MSRQASPYRRGTILGSALAVAAALRWGYHVEVVVTAPTERIEATARVPLREAALPPQTAMRRVTVPTTGGVGVAHATGSVRLTYDVDRLWCDESDNCPPYQMVVPAGTRIATCVALTTPCRPLMVFATVRPLQLRSGLFDHVEVRAVEPGNANGWPCSERRANDCAPSRPIATSRWPAPRPTSRWSPSRQSAAPRPRWPSPSPPPRQARAIGRTRWSTQPGRALTTACPPGRFPVQDDPHLPGARVEDGHAVVDVVAFVSAVDRADVRRRTLRRRTDDADRDLEARLGVPVTIEGRPFDLPFTPVRGKQDQGPHRPAVGRRDL